MEGGRIRLAVWASTCVAIASLSLAACGGTETDEERVRAAIDGLQEDFAAGDVTGVCSSLAERPKRQIGTVGHGRRPTTCERDLREFMASLADGEGDGDRDLARIPRPAVEGVRVAGRRAIATVRVSGAPVDVPLVERDGSWKLGDLFLVTGPVRRDLR